MTFRLSERSISRLAGVDDRLVTCVKRAIELTKVDFGVVEGLRTYETQKKYFESKKSHTMESKHLDGRAVDLVAFVDGSVAWELNLYDDIAEAMREAAKEIDLALRWGGAWNIPNICKWPGPMGGAINFYIDERRREGKRPFIDAPHFEIAGN